MDFSVYEGLERRGKDEIREVQEGLLGQHLRHLAANSPFYRRMFRREGINVDALRLDDLGGLPLTGKADLESFNDDFLAVPASMVRDIVMSSGTTGRPTRVMYTDGDLARLAFNEKAAFRRIGMGEGDVVLLTCTIDRCFIAGLAYYLGVQAAGAAAIRNGLNTFESHMGIILQMRPTALVGVPSFLYRLGLFMKERGIEPSDTAVRGIVCIGEPLRDRSLELLGRGRDLERLWGARVYSTYASSETVTTFCECKAQRGGHLHPALGIVEIVDEQGRVLPPMEAGEVVMTPLMAEGMPILRFRTGDVSFIIDEPCPCGRTSLRLGPILGRKKQMMKYHGTTLYPQAIFAVLDEAEDVAEYYVEVSGDSELSDIVKVCVSLKGGRSSSDEIASRLQARLRVRPEVLVLEEPDIRKVVYTESSRKPVRFIDRRNNHNGMP